MKMEGQLRRSSFAGGKEGDGRVRKRRRSRRIIRYVARVSAERRDRQRPADEDNVGDNVVVDDSGGDETKCWQRWRNAD